ncbi:WD40 repeat domain-containing protein [Sediminispirochaeta bajacaliforniensis]|uniref:WD40 repeat domain-containing protein n=1 Tax=Sediminispirochaeta bajacaliforniensis TaxID=148 RepID=UPI0003683F3E|nr:hypothetical protein [Sediminispirochaeta bajacaliforniensis]
MIRRLSPFLFLTLVLILGSILQLPAEVTVRSSHTASISSMERRMDDLLATTSEDGSVKIWNTREGFLVSSIQASHLAIPKLAIHPKLPRVALVTTDGINTFRLELWDWETKEQIFSKKIEEIPLFIAFSPSGSLLIYAKTDWQSLIFLNAEKGFEEHKIKEGFGIVSAVFITASEKTLLAYTPSGTLRYFDLSTGEAKANPIRTKSGLNQVQFTDDGLFLFGKEGNTLYAVSLVNGSIVAKQDIKGLLSISYDPDSSNMAVLSQQAAETELSIFSVIRDSGSLRFEKRNLPIKTGRYIPHIISFRDEMLFSGDNEGEILLHQLYSGETVVFARPRIAAIADFDFSERGMLLSLKSGEMVLIESDLFSTNGNQASFFRTKRLNAPYNAAAGAVVLKDGSFLVFPTASAPAPLFRLDPSLGTFTRIGEVQSPVVEAGNADLEGNIMLVEASGRVSILSPSGRKNLSQSSFGIRSAAKVSDTNIIAGRSNTGTLSSSLLRIDMETGETVPVANKDILVFRTTYNDITKSLYTLGYEERRGQLRTVLKSHDGHAFEREFTLLTYPGEDPDASFVADPNGTDLYTSLGYSGVLLLKWDGFTPLGRIEHIPRRLALHKNLLFSLNRDYSISMWSKNDGRALLTFYLFDDSNWAAVYEDGATFSSPEAKKLLHTK